MSNMSTFGGFTTARLGIYASQKALEVVGNNISNINTPGYTRQVLQQQSLYMGGADRYTSRYDVTVGSGALCTGISQLRDPYLDIRYRNAMSDVGAMDAKLSGLEQLSGILDEVGKGLDGEGVIEAQLNDMIEQLQNLVTQGAGKDDYDALVKGSASTLVNLFNTYADKLSTLKENQETGLRQEVKEVNSILSKIGDLNQAIRKSQIHGNDALELKDERNMLLDQLSQFVRVDIIYEDEEISAGMTVENLVIRLAGNDPKSGNKNTLLVDGNYVTQLSFTQVALDPPDPADPDATMDDPGLKLTLGVLTDPNGKVRPAEAGEPDPPAAVNLSDTDLYGSLQSIREMLTEKGEYAADAELAADGGAATKRGIPYYQNALDALANKLATVLNEANTLTDSGLPDDPYYMDDGAGGRTLRPEYSYYNGGTLFSTGDNGNNTDHITASNISISQAWASGEVHLLQSKEPHEQSQSTDNSNLRHILYLMDASHDYRPGDIAAGAGAASKDTVFFSGSFHGMLGDIASTLANDTKATTSRLENYAASANELYVNRDSISGVDLNDEAMGMMQYQKSYSAACRLLTTLDDMLDKLINGTGRAGL